MRVVLLPSSFAPHIGGIEEVTRQLARQLLASGDLVEVWTHQHPATLPSLEEIDGVVVRRFWFPLPIGDVRSLIRYPAAAGSAQRALGTAVRRFRPDVLHVHGFSGNGVHAAAVSLRRRIPLVVTLHGETSMDDHRIYEHSVSLRTGLRLGLRRAAAVTAPSRSILADARRFGLRDVQGEVIPNGVDLREPVTPTATPVPFERFVIALGRLVPNKGFDLLVKAFAGIAHEHPGLGLVIAGDGPQRNALAAQAQSLGVSDRVLLTGWLDRSQVAATLARADVFALPSRLEPFGVVVLEAMRAGVPVVASIRGGVGDWVQDEVQALLVDPEQVPDLAHALSRLLRDPALSERLVEAGRSHVARFEWSVVGQSYRDLYARVLA